MQIEQVETGQNIKYSLIDIPYANVALTCLVTKCLISEK